MAGSAGGGSVGTAQVKEEVEEGVVLIQTHFLRILALSGDFTIFTSQRHRWHGLIW